jgi:hypothetical protein
MVVDNQFESEPIKKVKSKEVRKPPVEKPVERPVEHPYRDQQKVQEEVQVV